MQSSFMSSLGADISKLIEKGDSSIALIFLIGVIFGGIIQFTRVDKFEKIAGFAMLKDTIVPKMLFMAVGISVIGLYYMMDGGVAHPHVKPLMIEGLVIGGVLFGISMAILGKCPGTGPVSIAEGRIDVLVGAIGGILGGLVFTLYYDDIFKPLMGEDLGKIVLQEFFKGHEELVAIFFGLAIIGVSILIPTLELEDDEENH